MNSEPMTPVHEEMFKTLLQTPHGQIDETLHIHVEQFDRDPNFYGKLAVYAVLEGNCAVRDVNEIFIAVLLNSSFQAHKEAGYVMFQTLPPHEAARVANYFTGYSEIVKHPSYAGPVPVSEQYGTTWVKAKFGQKYPNVELRGTEKPAVAVKLGPKSKLREKLLKSKKIKATDREFTVQEYVVHHKCLNNRNFKGSLRSAAKSYLKRRELNEKMMIGALLRSSSDIKTFYVRTNSIPYNDVNSWLNQYLWKGTVPLGTRLAALKQLQHEKDPTKQAEIIVENNLPPTLVTSVISHMTPAIDVALITVMSPQELMQSLAAFKARGADKNPDVKALIDSKLKKAKTTKKTRIDALKGAKVAASVAGLDEETRKLVTEITDAQLKQHSNISLRTALLIDKSFSMYDAIESGKLIGSVLAQACKTSPIIYMFDNMATRIEFEEGDGDITTKSAWDKKLEMYKARGGTAPDQVIRAMMASNLLVEQIVMVTDEGENDEHAAFATQLQKYGDKIGYMPNVIIARIGKNSSDKITRSLKARHIDVDVLICKDTDSVSIPNLIQFCSRKSVFDLVQEILSLKLPKRSEWDSKHLCAVAV